MAFIRGLDPLGLQNTSNATYSLLLPGLNNVTGRIRYYSFYCWLLDEYSQRIGSTDPADQRRFIRTAEYIIALASQFYIGDNGSIPGSNYAKKQVENHDKQNYDLNAGIYKSDGTTANTYWNYRWGAFGQYYLGSLRDIGLIIDRDINGGVYARTNPINDDCVSGEKLAKSFDKCIPEKKKKLFFSCLNDGFITEDQLNGLLPEFNLTQVPKNSEEQELLSQVLIQKDYPLRVEEEPVTFRKETIYFLLSFAESNPDRFDARQFVYNAYHGKGQKNGRIEPSLLGWYYYQFNEFWQYANTSILNGVLDFLESEHGPNWVFLSEFVDNIADLVVEKFIQEGLSEAPVEKLSSSMERLQEDEFHYENTLSQGTRIAKVFFGFLLMFSIYLNNKFQLELLREYGKSQDIARNGVGPGYFLSQFAVTSKKPIREFIRDYIFTHIIYRHQYVAFRKLGDIYNHRLQKFFDTQAVTEIPDSPLTIRDLSCILIAIYLIHVKYGKKFTVTSHDSERAAEARSSEEFYIKPGKIEESVESLKGFLLNILGKFLLLAVAGFKTYESEILNQKIQSNKVQLWVKATCLILNTPWRSTEMAHREVLLLNCLHFCIGKRMLDEKIAEDFVSKLNEFKEATDYITPGFDLQLEEFHTQLLPGYLEWLKKFSDKASRWKHLLVSVIDLRPGNIIFSSKIGFNIVKNVVQDRSSTRLDLTRAGYPFKDDGITLNGIQLGNKCIVYKR